MDMKTEAFGKFVDVNSRAVVRIKDAALAERIRLFLGGEHVRHQMPEAAWFALECAHALRAGEFDPRRVRKALWALDLSREPGARAERTAIFEAMREQPFRRDPERALEAEPVIGRIPDPLTHGMIEDPSLLLSMGGAKPEARAEEIRRNEERYDALIKELVAGGAVEHKVDWLEMKDLHRLAKAHPFAPIDSSGAAAPAPKPPLLTDGQKDALDWMAIFIAGPDREFRWTLPVVNRTILSLLAPLRVPGCSVAVRYVVPAMLQHYIEKYKELEAADADRPSFAARVGDNFVFPAREGAPILRVLPTSSLSRPDGLEELRKLDPDLVIVDEADFPPGSARYARLNEYVVPRAKMPRLIVWI